MEFKQYPSYKNSGVEWLGDVPDEWDIYPFWHLFNRKEITNKTQEQLLSVYLGRGVILHSEGGGMVHKPADNLEKYQLVEVNDFVMNNQQAWRGSVGVSPYKGIVSPAYLIFSFNKKICAPKFFKYFLRDKGVVDQFMIASMSVGTIQRQVKWHLLKTIQLSIPSLIEQNTIANFLDTETARIDNLIAKQEKLIELLEEQRKSIISHAVTKGLDPNAPMKDSGVEWLGDVPSHWRTSSIKYVCNIDTGNQDTVDALEDGKYPFFVRSKKIEKINEYSFDGEAVLTAGDGAGVGKIYHYINGKFGFHQRVYKMSNFKNILGKFFFFYFSSLFEKVALDGGAKSTVDSLRKAHFDRFIITIPEINEQFRIIEYIEHKTYKIDGLISKQKTLIEKLKEYRTSIISHAVTGKIDVREFC